MITLILDSREHKLLPLLKDIASTETLDVGDIMFKVDGEPYLILERKTYSDLASSIQGTRYKEQKARMKSLNCKMKGYLIEGPYPSRGQKFGRIPVPTLDSSILGTTIRDGYTMVHSQNLKHSADLIRKILAKLETYITDSGQTEIIDDQYKASLMSTVKKDNLTPEVCYLSQLAQIPSVSTLYAASIAKKYPTMKSLVTECKEVSDLADLIFTMKTGGTRRIGNAVANKIMKYLINPSSASTQKPKPKLILKPKTKTKTKKPIDFDEPLI